MKTCWQCYGDLPGVSGVRELFETMKGDDMFARQRSIIFTISLWALTAASAQAVEFVVTDSVKPTAKKIPNSVSQPAARSTRGSRQTPPIRRVEMTQSMPVEMLSPPGSSVAYPDPSIPFVDALAPADLPDLTVPLVPQAIQDPAYGEQPMPSPSSCNHCGETSADGSCTCGSGGSAVANGCTDMGTGVGFGPDQSHFAGASGTCGGCGSGSGSCGCGGASAVGGGLIRSGMSGIGNGLGSLSSGVAGGMHGLGSVCGGLGSMCGGMMNNNSCLSSDCNNGNGAGWFLNFWASQGYTYNADDPISGSNLPLTFNDRSNEYLFNQAYLSFGRAVSTSSWDLGGRIDLLYGSDYFFTQATGLETRQDGSPHWNSSDGPRSTGASIYGLALPQAYLELGVPFGSGTSVKVGHFYTTLGYESVMAPENFFYSHAYTMQYGEPFTHTGVLADIGITQSFNLLAGVTNGWDNFDNPNDELGYLFGFSWCPSPVASLSFGVHTGREDAAGLNDRTVYSMVYTRQVSSRLQYVMQHDFGIEANAETDRSGGQDSAKWYGINQYLFLEMSNTLTLGARFEWFRDQDNARVLAIPSETLVEGGNYVGLSLGANYRPNCRWIFRPEIRWDWSDVAATGLGATGMYNDFTEDNQLTLATDVIFRF